MTARLFVEAVAYLPEGERRFIVRGQTAKALIALAASVVRGVAELEMSNWVFGFAAYCHLLKRDFGLSIRTDPENHKSGWHDRHVLETPVRIVLVADPEQDAA
ncbi:MAG TPA: hypothetical protein VFB13_17610 [Reyranella sp.]|nr:hypothetical protein [Reyranella sp.]